MKLIEKLLSAAMILALLVAITACTQRVDEPKTYTPTAEQAEQEPPLIDSTAEQAEQEPRPIDWTPRAATTIAAGAYSSFVIQTDGTLWGWGIFGEIEFDEEETRLPRHQPHLIPTKLMEEVEAVSAGGWYSGCHVMALQSNGSLWGLGDNSHGQLGDGTTKAHNDFIQVMDDVIAVSTGGFHTMAILTDGTLWAWGGNWHGQLGDGTTTDRHIPAKIMDNVIAVSAGITYTMAITADNVLWGWGHNGSGRLGYAESAYELNPIHPNPIRIMDDVAAVSAAQDHTLAIDTDGSLWAWGNNSWGVLGGGPIEMPHNKTFSHTPIPTPNPIRIMDDVKVISAGDDYSMAVTSDGALWAWGFNTGRVTLGIDRCDTATGVIDRPMKVMDDVVAVSAWAGHTIAVKADGSVWTWGDNRFGQLGDGTQEERGNPVQISLGQGSWCCPASGPTPVATEPDEPAHPPSTGQVSTPSEGQLTTPSVENNAKSIVRRVSWVSGYGSEEFGEYSRVALMPGEAIRFEFDPYSFAGQARVEEIFRQVFKVETDSLVLKWESGETLLVSGPWEEGSFDFGVLEWDMPWVQYEIVPRHQVVAVTRGGQEVLFDVPVSTVGAIAMTNDFRSARFARPLSLEWLHMGLTEFVMDMHSGEVHMDKTIKHGSFRRENYMLLDWQQRTWEVMRELGLSGRAQGLSNDNSLLAVHGDGLRVYTRTGKKVFSYDIKRGELEFESEFSRFYCVFWSLDDSKLLYNNPRDWHYLDAYILDLQTGEAMLLGTDHTIVSVSPFSEHLSTRKYTQEGEIWSIMDYSGHSTKLNETNEAALVVKWIDSNRTLVNKYTERSRPLYSDSRCYIYHIAEGRWEYVAAGFGFDYDPLTGTAYLLRAATGP